MKQIVAVYQQLVGLRGMTVITSWLFTCTVELVDCPLERDLDKKCSIIVVLHSDHLRVG